MTDFLQNQTIADRENNTHEGVDPRVNEIRAMFQKILEIERDLRTANTTKRATLKSQLRQMSVRVQSYRSHDAALPKEGECFLSAILRAQQRIQLQPRKN